VQKGCHLSTVILEENQLRAIQFQVEIRFCLREDIKGSFDSLRTPNLPGQLISFPPDRDLWSAKVRTLGRKFVVADKRVKLVGVEPDGDTGFNWSGSFGRPIGDFFVYEGLSPKARP
jgi:hypothetical protein